MELTFDQKRLNSAAKKHGLKFVIVHGSYATGRFHIGSDLDVAILGKKDMSFSKFSKLFLDFETVFGNNRERELDLKTLHCVDPFFRYEVTRIGKLLFGNPTDYEDYKAYSLRAYEDAQPLFELEHVLAQKYQTHLNNLLHA